MRTSKVTLSLVFGLIVVAAAPMQGQSTFKLLHGFLGGNDGANPTSGVVFGPNGYLYGVTLDGGAYGWGTVFSISPGGRYKMLHAFTGGADGREPNNQLTWVGTSLYGGTNFGGAYKQGTLFKIDSASGDVTTVYTFNGIDGGVPNCTMIPDKLGNLYGTTFLGGAYGVGNVFFFEPSSGSLTTLYSFKGGSDGQYPFGRMARDANGNLYGATVEGGGANNFGTIFRLTASGQESVLYSFQGWPVHDVYNPYTNLFKDSAGNLYGSAGGGAGDGAVFKVSKTGQETIYNVPSGTEGPSAVVEDSDGNFYGTLGIVGYYGGVFKMDSTGAYTILYSFTGGLDGTSPGGAPVIRDAKGNLYGTSYQGGVSRKYGTVFELTFP